MYTHVLFIVRCRRNGGSLLQANKVIRLFDDRQHGLYRPRANDEFHVPHYRFNRLFFNQKLVIFSDIRYFAFKSLLDTKYLL